MFNKTYFETFLYIYTNANDKLRFIGESVNLNYIIAALRINSHVVLVILAHI